MSYYRFVEANTVELFEREFGKPIALPAACDLAGIGRRSARRWIQRGKLKPVGVERSRRGKPTLLVKLSDVLLLSTGSTNRPAWVQFHTACLKAGHDPRLVLAQIVWGSNADPDLLHAGMKLALEPGRFLDLLSDKAASCESFESFVADKLKTPLPPELPGKLTAVPFRKQWQNAQREVAKWTVNTTPALACYASGEPPKLVEYPKYRQGFTGHAPLWTVESVRSAGRKLRGQYRMILGRLQDATWQMRGPVEKPIQKDAMARFVAATSAAKAGDSKLAAKELASLGIPSISAHSFVRAWVAQKQSHGRLSAAAVARVFCKTE